MTTLNDAGIPLRFLCDACFERHGIRRAVGTSSLGIPTAGGERRLPFWAIRIFNLQVEGGPHICSAEAVRNAWGSCHE